MKNILVQVNDDDAAEARMDAAVALAHAFNGHVSCVQATPLAAYVASDMFGGVFLMPELLDAVSKRDERLQAETETRLAREGVQWDYVHIDSEPAQALVSRSRLADIVVVGRTLDDDRQESWRLVGDVALHARVPVLSVRAGDTRFAVDAPALVAWNGSFEAANALRAALPLLARASAIGIVTVEEQEPEFPMTGASEYLARHGLKTELHCVTRGNRSVEDALIGEVDRLGAGYVVMGAYGHSRAREFLLGGVTRHMLGRCPVPLLLAH